MPKEGNHEPHSSKPAPSGRDGCNYQHLRALLAIAVAVVLGLTIAVVVLTTSSNHLILARPTTRPAIQANPSAETGAKLHHSRRNTTGTND